MWAKDYVATESGKEYLGKIISLDKQAQEFFNEKDALGLKSISEKLKNWEKHLSFSYSLQAVTDEDFNYLKHAKQRLVYKLEDFTDILGIGGFKQ